MYVLQRFPLPPTSNQMYASVRGRFIKSALARRYAQDCERYKLKAFKQLDVIKETFQYFDKIEVETIFIFHKSRVISKKGTLNKLDASNRIKPCHDAIASVLGIDDCHFNVKAKIAVCDDPRDEQTIVVFLPSQLLTLDQIKQQLDLD